MKSLKLNLRYQTNLVFSLTLLICKQTKILKTPRRDIHVLDSHGDITFDLGKICSRLFKNFIVQVSEQYLQTETQKVASLIDTISKESSSKHVNIFVFVRDAKKTQIPRVDSLESGKKMKMKILLRGVLKEKMSRFMYIAMKILRMKSR